MRVKCEVNEVVLDGDDGREVDGVSVTCSRCQHSTESFGTGESSTLRCLALLREECPRNEKNYYIVSG